MRALHVERTGPLVLVQDGGRTGYADIGVSPSGAADRGAFALGARLLGQTSTAAGLECVLGGLAVRARGHLVVTVTGAACDIWVDGRAEAHSAVLHLHDGQLLEVGSPWAGLRCYLGVRGGLDVPAVLGSRSSDTLADLGPPPVRAGDVIPVGSVTGSVVGSAAGSVVGSAVRRDVWEPVVDAAPLPARRDEVQVLTFTDGPRARWCAGLDQIGTALWRVDARSDRVAVRLDGSPLAWAADRVGRELASEGVVRGAVQLPPSGQPVVFLADHPVTGGYPVIAVLDPASADLAAQLRPGDRVRLRAR